MAGVSVDEGQDDRGGSRPLVWSLDPAPLPPSPPSADFDPEPTVEAPVAPPTPPYDRPPTWGTSTPLDYTPAGSGIPRDGAPEITPPRPFRWLAVALVAALIGGLVGAGTYAAVDRAREDRAASSTSSTTTPAARLPS